MNTGKIVWTLGVPSGVLIVSASAWMFIFGGWKFDATVTPQAIIALFSLVLSVILSFISRRILTQIRASLSTKYLGEFPDYIPDITELVARARKELLIVCDHPGYGSLSAENRAERYRVAIQKAAADGVSIECLFLNKEGCAAAIGRQFFTSQRGLQNSENTFVPKTLVARLTTVVQPFIDKPVHTDKQNMEKDDFTKLVWDLNEELLKSFRHKRIRVNHIPGPMQLHFWIADGREAVFSVPNNTGGDSERAFHTGDHTLIRSLLNAGKRYQSYEAQLAASP